MFSPAGSTCVSIPTKLTDILGFATFVVMENRPWMSVAVNSFVPTIWIRAETRGSLSAAEKTVPDIFVCAKRELTHVRSVSTNKSSLCFIESLKCTKEIVLV